MSWGIVAGAVISTVGGAMLSDDSGAQGMNDSAAAASRQQAQIAQEQWDRWRTKYGPMEDEFLDESRGVGSISNQNRHAQQAAADVAGGFAKVRQQLADAPVNSPDARLREENRINLAEAAASAAGQTGAREATRTAGRAATTDALSLGRNLPANATSALGASASGMGSAARWAQQTADNTARGFGKMVGGVTDSAAFKNWVGGMTAPDTRESLIQNSPMGDSFGRIGGLDDY